MATSQLVLPGPIALVCSNRFLADIGNTATPFFHELDTLARQGVLPVTVDQTPQGGLKVAVHAARYVAWLYPTNSNDAYNVGHAGRRQFRDEARLTTRALLVRCPGLFAFPDLRSLNEAFRAGHLSRTSTYADVLRQAWQSLQPVTLRHQPSAYDRYLDLLEMVVDAGRQIETQRLDTTPPFHYMSCAAAKEERWSARGVYRFRLAGKETPAQKAMVCLGEATSTRGQVIRVEGRDVTVRFEPGADFDRIGRQGTLKMLAGDRIFRAQQDAIAQLRKRETRNPRLIDTLVAARFEPYGHRTDVQPDRVLDDDQRNAFQRALAVPDLLNVLGPPGAGKTTTIVEVVKAAVAMGERVLVTSHTHRAVDNVLEDLPPDLNVVRIGSEDNISGTVKALSSENRVESVRREILADTALLDALSQVREQRPGLDRHLEHLRSLLDQAADLRTELHGVDTAIADQAARVAFPLQPRLAHDEQVLAKHRPVVATYEESLDRVERQVARAQSHIERRTPFAFAWRWLLDRRRSRAEAVHKALLIARADVVRAESALATMRQRIRHLVDSDPEILRLTATRERTMQRLAEKGPELSRTGQVLHSVLVPLTGPAPALSDPEAFHAWCGTALALVERRAALLGEWRARIGDLSVELEREIASYAQVVGATCIGTDTSALISKLEFDLAIVDEAGQISTPNLLVPLVRAKRAMLVGDHKQLPPYLDEEVQRWADGLSTLTADDSRKVAAFLARSGFELLFPHAPASNAVWLRTQRRMPVEIAGFVSSAFYSGRLLTDHRGGARDAVFTSPFAMVDTSDRAQRQRTETAMKGRGEPIRHGYRNELEASIIVDLVTTLSGGYRDWAVIVPFNAQKQLVIERLTAVLGTSARVADNVGSVDSFQGGERDLVIFGFTRSNSRGDIGFLRELRRFNVAITRAKRQLVLVGDLSTLLVARDDEFRSLMKAMDDHLAVTGDLRRSLDVLPALESVRERS